MYKSLKILLILSLVVFTYGVQGNNISSNKNPDKIQFFADDNFSLAEQVLTFVPELENDQPVFNDIYIEGNYYPDIQDSGYRYFNLNYNHKLNKKAGFLLLDIPPPYAG